MTPEQTKKYLIAALAVLVLAAGFLLFKSLQQKQVIYELSEQFELDKEELEDEYSQLALQYESYGIRLDNDSLAELLDIERTKNLQLIEEIQTLKINNARRLKELKKELETARGVMRSYIVQIDSLNTANTRLKEENQKISRQYREARQSVANLSKQNSELSEKVMLAQMLEASDITVSPLTDKGRKAARLNRTAVIEFKALLAKNISAPVGEKNIYIRILQPDGTPLLKAGAATFAFEGSQLECSAFRTIEYDGEQTYVSLYWQVEEYLDAGSYRVDFFADGFLIGSQSFELKN